MPAKKTKTTAKKPAKKQVKKTAAKTKSPAVSKAKASPKTAAKTVAKEMEITMDMNSFQFDQMAQDAANQSREGFEAFMKSGAIFAKGFEQIMKTASATMQDAAEKQAEYARELMAVKSLNEFAEKQNKIAQASFDQYMADATKLSEMSVKVLSEASEPLNEQMSKAMNAANKMAA